MTPISDNDHTIYQQIAILADTSPSMGQANDPAFRAPIHDLNDALRCLYRDLADITHCGVECMAITFASDITVLNDFDLVGNLTAPVLRTGGCGTNLGGAIGRRSTKSKLVETT